MKVDLTLGLIDKPGQLLRALEPIAKNGGNIISIIHEREKTTGGYVPVSLVADFPTRENLEKTRKDLEGLGISIIKSEEIIEKSHVTCILIGKLDMRRIVDVETEGARIVDFEASSPTSKEACVKLNIEARVATVNDVLKKLKEMARKENAVLISSM